jgi:mRNA interferase HigB
MRIISKRRLRDFWQARKGNARIAERDLLTWFKLTKNAHWKHFADLKATFGSADQVGNCVVFDVSAHRFRLIGRVNYNKGIVYVLRVMDHTQYDRTPWADDCGCYRPPPPRTAAKRQPHEREKGRREWR